MKTLIEKSIEIYGMGHPEVKTIFNIEKEYDRLDIRFRPLTKISGRKLTVFFDYQNGDNKVSDKLQMTIIKSDDENDIKNYILSTINQYLS